MGSAREQGEHDCGRFPSFTAGRMAGLFAMRRARLPWRRGDTSKLPKNWIAGKRGIRGLDLTTAGSGEIDRTEPARIDDAARQWGRGRSGSGSEG